NIIKAVLNSGATVSIIPDKLRKILGIPINVPSKVIVIIAN
ncbi:11748_t:CDS:1, partial [Diversispora eburnea]